MLEKQNICVSRFIVIFALFQWSGTKPSISPRRAYIIFSSSLSLPSSFKSVSWDMIIDFDRVDWDYLASGRGIYPSFVVVNCPSLVTAGLLQMFIIVHRKDTWLCPCERVSEAHTHRERKTGRERRRWGEYDSMEKRTQRDATRRIVIISSAELLRAEAPFLSQLL